MENVFGLTEMPVIVENGDPGSGCACGNYVLFGNWPQRAKGGEVSVDESKCFNINGWNCYKGSDNSFYVKAETCNSNENCYFKLESIKWRILDNNYCGGKLLFAENILTSGCFDSHYNGNFMFGNEINRDVNGKTIYGNNYEFSRVRAFLNGLNGSDYQVEDFSGRGFINLAFTEKARNQIETVTVDNGLVSISDCENNVKTSEKFLCNNTNDKVFLLSEREVTKKEYGFDSYNYKSLPRLKKITDYSRAVGASSSSDVNCKDNGNYWLRSPVFDIGYFTCAVSQDGSAYYDEVVDETSVGIVPAIVISL